MTRHLPPPPPLRRATENLEKLLPSSEIHYEIFKIEKSTFLKLCIYFQTVLIYKSIANNQKSKIVFRHFHAESLLFSIFQIRMLNSSRGALPCGDLCSTPLSAILVSLFILVTWQPNIWIHRDFQKCKRVNCERCLSRWRVGVKCPLTFAF